MTTFFRLTGPEHVVMAELLLSGEIRTPHKWSDRIAAAAVHAQLAQTMSFASLMIDSSHTSGDDEKPEVIIAEWESAMATPEMTGEADDVLATWSKETP